VTAIDKTHHVMASERSVVNESVYDD